MAQLAASILQLDLSLKQGTDATINLVVVDADGNPITNSTGYSIRAQVRATPTSPVLFEWNSTPGGGIGTAALTYTAGPPAASTVALTVTGDQSDLLTFFGLARWDCFLFSPTGQETCLAQGTVTIESRITSI